MENLPTDTAPETPAAAQPKTRMSRAAIDVIETLLLALVLFVGINLVTARIRVDGTSMEPSLHQGEFVIINRLAYKWAKPRLGDVIVFRFPLNPGQELIKRVIGLPGDEVNISNNQVFVNGHVLDESYIAEAPRYSGTWRVPQDSLFVLGDNRNASYDSHAWGTVPLKDVIGKALFVYWPPSALGVISHVTPLTSP